MKLSEIDVLINCRAAYYDLVAKKKALGGNSVSSHFAVSGEYFRAPDEQAAMIAVLVPIIAKRLEEVKAKLMMLGVTEFPE